MRIYNILRRFYRELPELPDPRHLRLKGEHDYEWTPRGDTYDFLHPIEERNVWHRIEPERWRGYLLRLYKKARYDRKRAAQLAVDKAKAAKRHPPTLVMRKGRLISWAPPHTIDKGQLQEKPQCYWVEEQMPDGSWTRLQPPIYSGEKLERAIYGDGAARVAAYYPNEPQSLGWGFRYGPELAPEKPEVDPSFDVDPGPAPSRMDLIVEACRIYTGPRTKRTGAPYIRDLRQCTSFDPEITAQERNEAHRIVSAE